MDWEAPCTLCPGADDQEQARQKKTVTQRLAGQSWGLVGGALWSWSGPAFSKRELPQYLLHVDLGLLPHLLTF